MKAFAVFVMVSASYACPWAVAGPDKPDATAVIRTIDVALPNGREAFPLGTGADLANAHCVICHSVGMVTRQPPLSFQEWKAEVAKMRAVYGAPFDADQIEPIARYLTVIDGKP